MDIPTRKTALITGASSGIGRELTKLFAADGNDLVLVSRSGDELQMLAQQLSAQYGIRITVIAKDLFQPGAAEEIYTEVRDHGLAITYLVNDAGQGVYGPFVETDLQQELDIIQLNIVALVSLTKLFLKEMVTRNEGRILQLASLTSKNPTPLSAVYSATKAFIYNFSEALAEELRDTAVTVTALRPGATDTDFFRKEGAEDATIVREGKLAPPQQVAKEGYEAMMRGEDSVVSGMKNKLMDAAANVMPDRAVAKQMRKTHEPASQKQTESIAHDDE
jgi:short-subunit dehydrogenase